NYRTLGREAWRSPLQTSRPNSGKTLKSWKRPPASSIIHQTGLNMLNMKSKKKPIAERQSELLGTSSSAYNIEHITELAFSKSKD
ncbi:hypothetical protein ElyMa_003567200, partial [Elysia marginata]